LVGAEAVVESGGIVSRIGTYGLSIVAKELKKPFYVAAESQKFVRRYPNDTYEVPLRQEVVKYTCVEDGQMEEIEDNVRIPGQDQLPLTNKGEFVDYTHPKFITGIITENGLIMPSVVSHELMKMWY